MNILINKYLDLSLFELRYEPAKVSKFANRIITIRQTPIIDWEIVKLSKRELEVLKHIASEGPRIEYKLQGELPKMSRGTLHEVLKRLGEKKKLLKNHSKGEGSNR